MFDRGGDLKRVQIARENKRFAYINSWGDAIWREFDAGEQIPLKIDLQGLIYVKSAGKHVN